MTSDFTLLRRWIAARIRMILRTPRALFFTITLSVPVTRTP